MQGSSFRRNTIGRLMLLRAQAWDDIADIGLREGRIKLKRDEALADFDAQLQACSIDASAAKKAIATITKSINNRNSRTD